MTTWTTPTTWSSGNTPSASNFNTQIRDNMLHLKEGADGLGYAYTFLPHTSASGAYPGTIAQIGYIRSYGSVTAMRAIRIRVTASAGNCDAGAYRGIGTGMGSNFSLTARPSTLIDSAGDTAFPAIGVADILMLSGAESVLAGDWLAFGWDTGGATQAIYLVRPSGQGGAAAGYMGGGVGVVLWGDYVLAAEANWNKFFSYAAILLAIP